MTATLMDEDLIREYYRTPNYLAQQAYSLAKLRTGRSVEYEPAISLSGSLSYLYAIHIMGRFELGEPAISVSSNRAASYAEYVLKAPFPLGEPAIATNSYYSFRYAKFVIKGRFELGERAIANSSWITAYNEFILNCELIVDWQTEGF